MGILLLMRSRFKLHISLRVCELGEEYIARTLLTGPERGGVVAVAVREAIEHGVRGEYSKLVGEVTVCRNFDTSNIKSLSTDLSLKITSVKGMQQC